MEKSALISPCGTYRYTLWRSWAPVAHDSKLVLWIMLNPSTADASIDDNTVKKCIHYSKREGFQHMMVVNLCAYRSTDPDVLYTLSAPEASGPDNERHVIEAIQNADRVVCAWGNPGGPGQPIGILHGAGELWCLGTNKNGSPRHPLYLPKSTPMIRWQT